MPLFKNKQTDIAESSPRALSRWVKAIYKDGPALIPFTKIPLNKSREAKIQASILGVAYAGVAGIILYNFATFNVAPEIFILTATVLTLGGLYLADFIERRRWEQEITKEINDIKIHQDDIARDVSRSRTDLKKLQSGLHHAVESVRAEGKRFSAPETVEARMLDILVSKLGDLSQRPRSLFRAVSEADQAIGLKSTPPKGMSAPPQSDLEKATTPDYGRYSDAFLRKIVNRALDEDKIALFMQPVVNLPQRSVKMFELFARVQSASGSWLPAAHYMDMIRRGNHINELDNRILMRSLSLLKVSHHTAPDVPCIMNITAATLNNRTYLAGLVKFLSQNRDIAKRIIFEVPYKDLDLLRPNQQSLIEALTKLGCRFSVDQVYQRRIRPERLSRLGVRFIKMDAGWLHREYSMPHGRNRLIQLKSALDRAGVDIIVEKMESEDILRPLLDISPAYGQGYLFGKPDLPVAWKEMRAA